MKEYTLLKQFSFIAILEGISYLILLFIAMPLKYLFDQPEYVTLMGSIHGGLTIAFLIWLALCYFKYKWTIGFSTQGFIFSLIPFGAFIFDKKLKTILQNSNNNYDDNTAN
ncbi:MAG TPA: DUF3817 domain-containing protein [Chitinophagales bacterium]|nr:DUF3817 domain-containing protein [Chitinophagales bacterium]